MNHLHLLILSFTSFCSVNGFYTTNLIHRDSLLSPLYNRSLTSSELLRQSVLQSFSPINHINTSSTIDAKYVQTNLDPDHGGDYLMSIYVGDFSYKVLVLPKLLSELTWINCNPCTTTYVHSESFYAQGLSDQNKVLFSDAFCQALEVKHLNRSTGECLYEDSLGGGYGYSRGTLTRDNISISDESNNHPIVFGCSHETTIDFKNTRIHGVFGLAGGLLSLVSQWEKQIEHKFSYCLVRLHTGASSKIRFGSHDDAETFALRATTPYTLKPDIGPFYYLTLQAFTIGAKKKFIRQEFRDITIDFGRFMTLLSPKIFFALKKILLRDVGIEPREIDPFKICFEMDAFNRKEPPTVQFHFLLATVLFKPYNIFVDYEGYRCLAIAPLLEEGVSILGSIAQQNFEVQYDLKYKSVSFAQRDCTNF